MSSLQDPFDLITTDKGMTTDMEKIIPFLSQNKIDQMVDNALRHQQVAPRKISPLLSRKVWWSGGLATAACLLLLMFFSPLQIPTPNGETTSLVASHISADEMREFNDLAMLDTLDSY